MVLDLTYVTREQEYQIKAFGLVFAFTIKTCKKIAMLLRGFNDSEEKNISYYKL